MAFLYSKYLHMFQFEFQNIFVLCENFNFAIFCTYENIVEKRFEISNEMRKIFFRKPASEENQPSKKKDKTIAFFVQAYFKICMEKRSKEIRTIDRSFPSFLFYILCLNQPNRRYRT